MTKSKLNCRYCKSEDLYLQQCIVTRADISEDNERTISYEAPVLFYDEVIEEYTCYGCDSCSRDLTIDDEHGSGVIVTEKNLEEYRQKYCSGD